jgi:hypothetical protein
MPAGDATFHAGWTLHHAMGNPTQHTRAVMTVIYVADGARLIEPDSPEREADLRELFPGLRPGDPASSELHTLVYGRGGPA